MGIYVDGVYQGRSDNYNQELIDISQIEVLRGPQGALFGKNTIAGVFNITTAKPGDTVEGQLNVEGGDYSLFRTQGYVMGPLIDGVLSGKISGGYVTRDGVYKHLSGGPNGDALDLLSYRTALYYTPTAKSEFVLALDGLHDRGRPAFFQVTDLLGVVTPMATTPHRIDNNRPDYLHRDNYGVSLTGTIDLGFATLTSISAYRNSSYQASLDDDQAQVDYLSTDKWGDKTKFFSQEARLSGQIGEAISYVTGLYYFGQTIDTDRILTLGSSFMPGNPPLTTKGRVTTNSYAAFGNIDYHFNERLMLSAGLRYTIEKRAASFNQGDPTGIFAFLGLPTLSYAKSATSYDLSPMASLSYKFTPDIMAYARVAQGYKSASFNVDLVSSPTGLYAAPETAITYELGLKSEFFEKRVRANFAIFDTDYTNMQVSQLLGSGVTLNNAGAATIKGAEAELLGYVTPDLKLEGSLGYLDAVYDRYTNCGVPASLGGGVANCSGNRIIAAPKFTYQAAAEYTYPTDFGAVVARVDFSGQTPVFFEATNSPRFESDTRGVLNTRLSVVGGRWEVSLWAKNLLDDVYITYRDDRSAIGVLQTTAYGDPRTVGATLSLHL